MKRPALLPGLPGLLVLLPLAALGWQQPTAPESESLLPQASYESLQLDGGTPDGSVGNGGADRDSPEGGDSTGRAATVCDTSRDCSPRFSCAQGRCRYTGVRDAEHVGCLLGPETALAVVGLTLAAAWRRGKERA